MLKLKKKSPGEVGVCVSLPPQAFPLIAPSSSVEVVIIRNKVMMVAEIMMMKMMVFPVIIKMMKMIIQGVPKKRTFRMLLKPQCTGSITIVPGD